MAVAETPMMQAADPGRAAKLDRAAWRGHFHAGLFVIPFFLVLAVTGMMILWIAHLDGRDGERISITPVGAPASLTLQAAVAIDAVPGGKPLQHIVPKVADLAAIFRTDRTNGPRIVVVHPYAAQVITDFPRRSCWYDWADNTHGTLLLGVAGDRMIEVAASLGVMLLATGLYNCGGYAQAVCGLPWCPT